MWKKVFETRAIVRQNGSMGKSNLIFYSLDGGNAIVFENHVIFRAGNLDLYRFL